MVKYTKHTLKKIEELFKELDYTIRYERGNFQSGYCIVENRRIAVVNKFYDTEARINCLLEILTIQKLDVSNLSEKGAEFHKKLTKHIAATKGESEEEVAEVEEESAELPVEETAEVALTTTDEAEETPAETEKND